MFWLKYLEIRIHIFVYMVFKFVIRLTYTENGISLLLRNDKKMYE